jgi:hypothetical protein
MEFESFPKIPRLNRDIVITEKIDGTNAAVLIEEVQDPEGYDDVIDNDEGFYVVQAQSRNRLITPGKTTDNYGFAGWVRQNAAELVDLLGPGRHFGEWWGTGIARGYGFTSQRNFSLFRPGKIDHLVRLSPVDGTTEDVCVDTVPVLYEGPFEQVKINGALSSLRYFGSVAAPGFDRPEGIIVYHVAARQSFKVTLEHDEAPKGKVASE